MRRAPVALLVACVGFSVPACSLFVSLDDLSDGSADAASVVEASATDAGTDVSSGVDSEASVDAGPAILSCTADGLVSYWAMNEGSGSTVHDCASQFDGLFSDNTNVTWGTRNGGSSIEFSSISYVSIGIVPELNPAGAFTVAGWFRSDVQPTNYVSLFWNYDGGNSGGFEITLGPDNHLYGQVGFSTSSVIAILPTPTAGQWMHLALVYEPGVRVETYFNGVSFDKETSLAGDSGPLPTTGVPADDHEVRLGADDPDSTWQGGVDDIRFFARALTSDEIEILASE